MFIFKISPGKKGRAIRLGNRFNDWQRVNYLSG